MASVLFQLISAALSGFRSLFDALSEAINNKWVVGTIVIALGSVYPLILKYTKDGQSKYPFMIGVAVCVKNILMLFYYFARYLLFLYSEYDDKNKEFETDYSHESPKSNHSPLTQSKSLKHLLIKSEAISLHKFARNSSEIQTLNAIEMENIQSDESSKQFVENTKWKNITNRLKLYCYLAPNALLVLVNDILALYTLYVLHCVIICIAL